MYFKLIAALAAIVLSGSMATAEITDAYCYDDGDGAITMGAWDWNELTYEMDMAFVLHWFPGHAFVDFEATPEDPIVTIFEEIENDTDFAWTDYHIVVSRDQDFDILDAATVLPADWTAVITPVSLIGSEYVGIIDYYAGTAVPVGDTLTLKLKLSFLGNANFCLEQVPTPEPATLALLSVGTALIALRRRRFARH